MILVLPWMTPLRCSDAGVDIVDRSWVASGMSEVIRYKLMVPGLEMTLMVSEVKYAMVD